MLHSDELTIVHVTTNEDKLSTFAHLAAVRLDTVPSTSISTDMGLELGEVIFHLLQC